MRIRFVSTISVLALVALTIGFVDGTAQEPSGTPVPVASPTASGEIVLVEIEDYEFIPSRVEIDGWRHRALEESRHQSAFGHLG